MVIPVNSNPGYEPQKSGFELSKQEKAKQIAQFLPKDKAKFVEAYGKLVNKKRGYLLSHEDVPQALLDTLQVWDSHLYKHFSPQERKLIHQQAIMQPGITSRAKHLAAGIHPRPIGG